VRRRGRIIPEQESPTRRVAVARPGRLGPGDLPVRDVVVSLR
jgi:hypothetical protein